MPLPGNPNTQPTVQVPLDLTPGTSFSGIKFEQDLANNEALVKHVRTLYTKIAALEARLKAASIP